MAQVSLQGTMKGGINGSSRPPRDRVGGTGLPPKDGEGRINGTCRPPQSGEGIDSPSRPRASGGVTSQLPSGREGRIDGPSRPGNNWNEIISRPPRAGEESINGANQLQMDGDGTNQPSKDGEEEDTDNTYRPLNNGSQVSEEREKARSRESKPPFIPEFERPFSRFEVREWSLLVHRWWGAREQRRRG